MPSKKTKTAAANRKPFKVLTRKAVIGWLVGIFVAFGWMFALGVLVGRDQAPVEFDLNALEKKIERLRQKESGTSIEEQEEATGSPGDKKQLEFYEALPENREDTDIPEQRSGKDKKQKVPAVAEAAPEPVSGSGRAPEKDKRQPASGTKPAPENSSVASRKGAYTIQAASVRNRPDAERLVSKLSKRGFPAFVLTSEIKGKGTWHRVRIGSYASKEAAGPVLDRLRQAGMKPILVLQK